MLKVCIQIYNYHDVLHVLLPDDETTWTSAGSRSQKGNDRDVKFRNEFFFSFDATLKRRTFSRPHTRFPGNTNNGRTESQVYDTSLKELELILTVLLVG